MKKPIFESRVYYVFLFWLFYICSAIVFFSSVLFTSQVLNQVSVLSSPSVQVSHELFQRTVFSPGIFVVGLLISVFKQGSLTRGAPSSILPTSDLSLAFLISVLCVSAAEQISPTKLFVHGAGSPLGCAADWLSLADLFLKPSAKFGFFVAVQPAYLPALVFAAPAVRLGSG
jgi:hypothetical protein